MATKRRRVTRSWSAPVSEAQIAYLLTGEYPADAGAFWDVFEAVTTGDIGAAWAAVRAPELAAWVARHPGTRPAAWWTHDAPAWPAEAMPERYRGGFWTATLREPRRRLGGVGTASHDALNYKPVFRFGLPASGWVTEFDVAYYNGRARDIHGNRIGTEYTEGHFPFNAYDPANPPRFESQASYLDRHGLLTTAERRRLPADAFAPELIVCEDGGQ